MSDTMIIFFLSVCIVVLIGIILYQQFAFPDRNTEKIKNKSARS